MKKIFIIALFVAVIPAFVLAEVPESQKLAQAEKKVDALFIAGDLFEQNFVERGTIEYIISNLQLIPDVSIFITPGNHDPFIKDSPYEIFEWPENVTIFKSEYGMISLEDADIYGVGFEDYEMDNEAFLLYMTQKD